MRFDWFGRLALGFTLVACGGEVYTADDRPAVPSPLEAPVPNALTELGCEEGPPFAERVRYNGLSIPQFGACGALSWTDALGDFYLLAEGADEPQLLFSGASRRVLNRRNDTFLLSPDGVTWTWVRADGSSEPFTASRVGFVRDGDAEIAWACVGDTFGTVDEEGFSPRVDDVRLCDRLVTASDAPVFVFVGADFTLQALDLRGPRLFDLSEVPYVAAGTDRLRLSRDGRILAHQRGEVANPRVGFFDLDRDPGDRLIGAPRPTNAIYSVQDASRAGHVMALSTEEAVVVVGPDARLYDYPGATLLGVDPSGAAVLLGRPADGGNEIVLGHPGGRDTVLSQVGPELRVTRQSAGGASTMFVSLNAESRNGSLAYVTHRFGSERLLRPNLSRSPHWLGVDGSILAFGRVGVELLDPFGIPRRRFDSRPTLLDLTGNRVVVSERTESGQVFSVVSTDTGELTPLFDDIGGSGSVIVSPDRTRVMAFRQFFDSVDPAASETVVAAGRP